MSGFLVFLFEVIVGGFMILFLPWLLHSLASAVLFILIIAGNAILKIFLPKKGE